MTDHVQIIEVTYFSITHLTGANSLAKIVKGIEGTGKTIQNINIGEYQSYCSTVVILCAAFLEAYINEFYSICAERPSKLNTLPDNLVSLYGRLWNYGIPRTAMYSILQKYELALAISGLKQFNKGAPPYQDVSLMVQLRNSFVHYEPEEILAFSSLPTTSSDIHNIEKKLKGRFPESKMWPAGNPFYPDRMLGFGCCAWAINHTIDFYDLFNSKMSLKAFQVDQLRI
jgi:hypothetical protein